MTLMHKLSPLLAVALAVSACSEAETPTREQEQASAPAAAPASDPAPSEIPAGFIGVWDYEKGTCDPAPDMRLAIGQDRFEFYESVGEVKAVRNEGEATVVDLAMEGEGETWDQSLRLVLKDSGERLHVTEPVNTSDTDDYPRKRCPA